MTTATPCFPSSTPPSQRVPLINSCPIFIENPLSPITIVHMCTGMGSSTGARTTWVSKEQFSLLQEPSPGNSSFTGGGAWRRPPQRMNLQHICAHVCRDAPVCVRPCRAKRLVLAVSIYCSTAYWFHKNSLSELGTHPSGQDVWSPRNMLDSVPPALRFHIHAPGALNQAHRLSQQLICYLSHLLQGPCCRLLSYCKSLTLRFSAKPKGLIIDKNACMEKY